MSVRVWIQFVAGLAAGAGMLPGQGAVPDTMPSRGIVPGAAYQVGGLDTVNAVNGNLLLRIPMAAFPPGHGGQTGGWC